MSICRFIKIIVIFPALLLSASSAKETVSPLDFQTIGTEHVEQTSDPTSFGNKPIRALGLSSLSNLSPAGNDAYLVSSSRPTMKGNYKPMFLIPIQSPISPMVNWRPQGIHRSWENIEDDTEGLTHQSRFVEKDQKDNRGWVGYLKETIKREDSDKDNQEYSPDKKSQIASNHRAYRSENSAKEYKLLRRLRSTLPSLPETAYNFGRQSSYQRYFLFKKGANARNTRDTGDQSDYYLRFLPTSNFYDKY